MSEVSSFYHYDHTIPKIDRISSKKASISAVVEGERISRRLRYWIFDFPHDFANAASRESAQLSDKASFIEDELISEIY
jgi:hypothetical protein